MGRIWIRSSAVYERVPVLRTTPPTKCLPSLARNSSSPRRSLSPSLAEALTSTAANPPVVCLDDQIDVALRVGAVVAELQRLGEPSALSNDLLDSETLQDMPELGHDHGISGGQLRLTECQQVRGQAGVDNVHLGCGRDPRTEGSAPGGKALKEEDRFQQGDVVADEPLIELEPLRNMPGLEDATGLCGDGAQDSRQDGSLPDLPDLQDIPVDDKLHIVVEPAGSRHRRAAQRREWQPAGERPSFIVGPRCGGWLGRYQAARFGQQRLAEVTWLVVELALSKRPHIDELSVT
jgi:hypothetical protein